MKKIKQELEQADENEPSRQDAKPAQNRADAPSPKLKRTRKKAPSLDPNPERGKRSGFFKLTITMKPELLGKLQEIGLKRRIAGEKNRGVSELIREAVANLVERETQEG